MVDYQYKYNLKSFEDKPKWSTFDFHLIYIRFSFAYVQIFVFLYGNFIRFWKKKNVKPSNRVADELIILPI